MHARVLIGCYRQADFADVDVASSAFVNVLMRYPEEVGKAVCAPATGIPSKLKWPPSIAEVVAACDAELAPMLRQLRRDQITYETLLRRSLAPPEPKLDLEDILARMDEPTDSHADDDLKADKRDDPDEKAREDSLDAVERAKTAKLIEREYAAINRDPAYCGTADREWSKVPISPSLARLIDESRSNFCGTGK